MFRNRPPVLQNTQVRIRVAHTPDEIEAANQLIYRNYVAEGFWPADVEAFRSNKNLNSPARTVFVAVEDGRVVGTVSLMGDSLAGLPSDEFQPALMQDLRAAHETLGEISCLAIDKSYSRRGWLIFFLMRYYLQYSFYYAAIDRLVKTCRPQHADFYANVLRFDKIGPVRYCDYAHRPSQMLSANLFRLHRQIEEHYRTPETDRTLYHFFLIEEHPSLIFPADTHSTRPRSRDWLCDGAMMPPSGGAAISRKNRAVA